MFNPFYAEEMTHRVAQVRRNHPSRTPRKQVGDRRTRTPWRWFELCLSYTVGA